MEDPLPCPIASEGNLGLAVCGLLSRIIVTHAYICFSINSTYPRGMASTLNGMLPYRTFVPRTSVVYLMPVYYPRFAARLVSCYALFE